jgi:hypothetical protein
MTSLIAVLCTVACNDSKCDSADGASCGDVETEEPSPPKDTEEDAAASEVTSDEGPVDAGLADAGEPPQPFLDCNARATALPISEVANVTASCETAGIGGWWYCFQDGVNPSGCVDGALPFDPARSGLCLTGSTTYDPEYIAWGAGLGITLNESEGRRRSWNATVRDIVGFKFVITGETNGLSLRVLFTTSANDSAEDPMVDLPGVGEHEVLFENVVYPRDSRRAGEPVDPETLFDAQLMVVGAESEDTYDFCLTELTPIYSE